MNRLIRIILVIVLCLILLGLGGYTWKSFKEETHLRNPYTILSPLFNIGKKNTTAKNTDTPSPTSEEVPKVTPTETVPSETITPSPKPTVDYSNEYIDENGNLRERHSTEHIPTEITVSIGGAETTFTEFNTLSCIKWLETNYSDDAEIVITDNSQIAIITTTPTITGNITPTPVITLAVVYNNTLENKEDLQGMVQSITVIAALPDYDDYDRNTFEKPVQGYKLNGQSVNRNKYAWKTSVFLVSEDPFEYICPYTGTPITEAKKLDYDHIVPLKSAYLRGAKDWPDSEKNKFAYDQNVGIDVLSSANRSKSDKGPANYLPAKNVEDYCYAWLYLCSYYHLAMTQEEIDICVNEINAAFERGETVEFLGMY